MSRDAKYGEALTIVFPMVKRGVVDLAVGADWTPATGDVKVTKDAGNVANTTNLPSALGGTGAALWSLTLTGLEMQAAEVVVQVVDAATKAVEDNSFKVVTYGHNSAGYKGDRAAEQAPRPAEVTASSFNSDATAHTVSMPASAQAGDLLLCLFANDGSATVTTPTGWTQLHTTVDAGNAVRMGAYAKESDGTEGGTTVDFVTSSAERAAAQVYRFPRGAWYGDPNSSFGQSVVVGTAATGTSTTPDPPALAPPWKALNSLYLAVEANDDGTVTDSAYPSNYVDRLNTVSDANAAGVSLTSAVRSNATASENPGAFTIASQEWVAQTVCVRPAQPAALSDANVVYSNGTPVSALADLYHAEVQFTRDQANTQDEWTVRWFKNGVRVTAGVTSPTLTAVKRADGTNLINGQTMTQIGSTGAYKYNATSTSGAGSTNERVTVGEAVEAVVSATIDSAARTFSRLIGRDSS